MQKLPIIVIATLIVTIGFTILSFEGFSLSEIIAQEAGEDKGYNFAEDTVITGIFQFNDGPEISRFEIFRQVSGFQSKEIFVFQLEKIVGSNPQLHKAADRAFLYRNSPAEIQDKTEFDVKNAKVDKDGLVNVMDIKEVYTETGKEVGQELSKITALKLFHNHMTND